MMFLGIHDPMRTYPASAKVSDGIKRYREKFGSDPEIVLASCEDAADLATEGFDALPVRAVTFVSRYTFYIGIEDTEAA